jgi:hypothetical protein
MYFGEMEFLLLEGGDLERAFMLLPKIAAWGYCYNLSVSACRSFGFSDSGSDWLVGWFYIVPIGE